MPDVPPSFGERTIGCRRMHGCAHSSKTLRSAKPPITVGRFVDRRRLRIAILTISGASAMALALR
jgi:hypothetical protein